MQLKHYVFKNQAHRMGATEGTPCEAPLVSISTKMGKRNLNYTSENVW